MICIVNKQKNGFILLVIKQLWTNVSNVVLKDLIMLIYYFFTNLCTNKLSSSSKFRVEDGLTRSFIVVFFANFDCQISLNGNFIKNFIVLNIIIFADMRRREKDVISWDARRVSLS